MTQLRFIEQPCQKFRAKLDSYIDNELMTESNLEFTEHFQRCTECTRETEERRKVRDRLKAAVRETTVPVGLERLVRGRLRQQAKQNQPKKIVLMAIAATLAVCFGIIGLQDSSGALIRLAFDNHVNCAVIHHPAAHGGNANRLPDGLKELTPLVQERVPPELPLVLAHQCRIQGRSFVHLTFGNGRNLLSLVITRRENGESIGKGVRRSVQDRYQLAALQTGDYLVYTVSDLPAQKNLDILMALAPPVQKFLVGTTAAGFGIKPGAPRIS
jgi:hypothetical protein